MALILAALACAGSGLTQVFLDPRLALTLAAIGAGVCLAALLSDRSSKQTDGTSTSLTRSLPPTNDGTLNPDESRDRLVAIVSHEIRTALTGIIGTVDMLGRTDLSYEQRQIIELAQANGETLLRLVDDLLTYSKLAHGTIEVSRRPCDPRLVLKEAVQTLRPLAEEKRATIHQTIAKDLPRHLEADPVRLRQIFGNLIANGIVFAPGGTVDIELTWRPVQESLVIEVSDNGVGMDQEQLLRVFEPFVQVRQGATDLDRSAGLGLATCNLLVRLMDGTIEVVSEAGSGSSFTVALPARPCEEPDGYEPSDHRPFPPGLQVLVAEDNPTSQLVVRAMLAQLACTVTLCETGEAAVAAALARDFPLILLDVHLPDIDGVETAQRIRSHHGARHSVILALSADALAETRSRCLAAGMDGFLVKPVSLDRLRDLLWHFRSRLLPKA